MLTNIFLSARQAILERADFLFRKLSLRSWWMMQFCISVLGNTASMVLRKKLPSDVLILHHLGG